MLKATLRCAVLLGLVAWSLPALAEVQNVKVSGDVTVRAFHRSNLDLHANDGGGLNGTPGINGAAYPLDDESFLMSTIGLNIGADLTENVSTFVRLANERDWNAPTSTGSAGTADSSSDFALSQGYVTLKELFYAPLTLKIGQQPIVWGRGFVLGSNLLPSILLDKAAVNNDLHASITANEYTDFTAFDAIRATLDLSNVGGMNLPVTADYVYIKLDENSVFEDDDVTVQGLNFGTKFDAAKSEAELYYLFKHDSSPLLNAENGGLSTLGIRGSAQPGNCMFWGELAWQFGTRPTDLEGVLSSGSRHQAWAFDFGGEHTFKDISMTPKLGGEWRFYSGKSVDSGAAPGWAAIAPGYFTTAIREFQGRRGVTGFNPVVQGGVTSGQTNQHEFGIFGGLKPLEDLRVDTRLSWFALAVGAIPPTSPAASAKRKHFIGTEWDTNFAYSYTDDVQFGLLYALFLPGNVFRDAGATTGATPIAGDAIAQQLVTTVSVKF